MSRLSVENITTTGAVVGSFFLPPRSRYLEIFEPFIIDPERLKQRDQLNQRGHIFCNLANELRRRDIKPLSRIASAIQTV
ncbi:hypothetical protein A2690_00750 [Candidatus Roizmanbacteria bacterium RIFCSPHIGHO2_01_FULL_39_12b]|uniref:Uncharacterized protein n=1 Tax=Candidatus Roizmanbacteria bacterium RIFCSPHIGHO2_01_FULL_39_12b TaxID=1802030 RepID=A0A1F7GAQ1_9BACT|nr:MAG: hypothetical protein A2690_00750 [Candidatus Roizmanbacteria bacterium RIFCSPHIGHO2_01_FULL_39_12b]